MSNEATATAVAEPEIQIDGVPGEPELPAEQEEYIPAEERDEEEAIVAPTPRKKKNVKVLKFRYRSYVRVMDFLNEKLHRETGELRKFQVKARNWLAEFDMDDPDERRAFETLRTDKDFGSMFFVLADRKESDSLTDRSRTLEQLMGMNIAQLSAMLTPDEKENCGLPRNCMEQAPLITACMDLKKLEEKRP
jgi:hypothetical protein